ncbi:MAG TPA: PQQ-dependent sugar dehydrogenase [Steroidobacteraceae bacterium]|nr:PQQ-dependent sugar dehydrogenase [Steroidobacteraceae bacterium]
MLMIRAAKAALLAGLVGCSGPVSGAQGAAAAGAPLETRDRNARTYEPAFAGQTRAPGIRDSVKLNVQEVATGLAAPWAVELLPDGRFLVTEKQGNLRIVSADGTLSAPVSGVPQVAAGGQGGLLDVALDPAFATNRTIYLSYAEQREGGNGTNLAKGVLSESGGTASLTNVSVIFRMMPTFQSGAHFGSRIVFAPDGKLFLTLGERSAPASRVQSQDLNSHFGKVVRINTDGTAPADNPFVGRADAKPEVWSYGHRNVQAATIDSATGKLWTVEHGPRGGDELNHPEPGKNYGWPVITYGIDYPGPPIGEGIQQKEGMEQPVYYWDPVIAPSGMIVYRGRLFPQWQGSIFIGGLSSAKLVRLQMDGDKVVGEEWLLTDRREGFRDVQQGPDGAIYVLTQQGKLLRLTPASG